MTFVILYIVIRGVPQLSTTLATQRSSTNSVTDIPEARIKDRSVPGAISVLSILQPAGLLEGPNASFS
jgi:hypothetical protein